MDRKVPITIDRARTTRTKIAVHLRSSKLSGTPASLNSQSRPMMAVATAAAHTAIQ